MSVKTAVSDTLETISDHPSIALYAGLTGLLLGLSGNIDTFVGGTGTGVGLGFSLLLLLITPFLMGGLIGLVSSTRDGNAPSFAQFRESGVENYFSLVLMTVAIIAGAFSFALVAVVLMLIPGVNLVFAILMFPLGLGIMFVLQFIDVSIVVGDSGPLSTFRDSYELVRDNLVSVIGYMLVRWTVSLVGVIPMMYLMLDADLTDPTAVESLMVTPEMVGTVLFSGVVGGLMYIFHTVYYRTLVGMNDEAA